MEKFLTQKNGKVIIFFSFSNLHLFLEYWETKYIMYKSMLFQ